ncbi:MAG: hypothetical protein AB4041_20405 [Microcystaceae cyanobacterium]
MKIILDIDKLLAQGRITKQQYQEFQALAEEKTGNLALNVLIGFGIWATALGLLNLIQSTSVFIQLGLIMAALGLYCRLRWFREWIVLAYMLLSVGTLMVTVGILMFLKGGF